MRDGSNFPGLNGCDWGTAPSRVSIKMRYAILADIHSNLEALRAPFEIVFPQLVAYHLSRTLGMNPDLSSPRGVINRVVQGVRLHD